MEVLGGAAAVEVDRRVRALADPEDGSVESGVIGPGRAVENRNISPEGEAVRHLADLVELDDAVGGIEVGAENCECSLWHDPRDPDSSRIVLNSCWKSWNVFPCLADSAIAF